MANNTIEYQSKLYVYDLNNSARENGFKADDVWELNVATAAEKSAIEKKYYPTISTKILPELLLELLRLVKGKLVDVKYDVGKGHETSTGTNNNMEYLIAFNAKRPR
jgi:hypothetical protein